MRVLICSWLQISYVAMQVLECRISNSPSQDFSLFQVAYCTYLYLISLYLISTSFYGEENMSSMLGGPDCIIFCQHMCSSITVHLFCASLCPWNLTKLLYQSSCLENLGSISSGLSIFKFHYWNIWCCDIFVHQAEPYIHITRLNPEDEASCTQWCEESKDEALRDNFSETQVIPFLHMWAILERALPFWGLHQEDTIFSWTRIGREESDWLVWQ